VTDLGFLKHDRIQAEPDSHTDQYQQDEEGDAAHRLEIFGFKIVRHNDNFYMDMG
jgi:hypothetical protein